MYINCNKHASLLFAHNNMSDTYIPFKPNESRTHHPSRLPGSTALRKPERFLVAVWPSSPREGDLTRDLRRAFSTLAGAFAKELGTGAEEEGKLGTSGKGVILWYGSRGLEDTSSLLGEM